VTSLGSGSFLREQKTVVYDKKLRHTCVKICVTFSPFAGSKQTNGLSRSRCPVTWRDIDLAEKTITFVQRKTGSSVQVPIHQDLYDYLVGLPRSDSPKRPVFPKLFNKPGAGKSGLSMAFKRLMERAGIDDGVARKKDGKLGRNVSRLSFHSLRHSFNSAMANADVPLEISQKLTGHASQDMNKH
jgi:integrase